MENGIKKLSSLRKAQHSAPIIAAEKAIEHGDAFLLGGCLSFRDVLFQSIIFTGVKCGMRLDEVSKVKMDVIKCLPGGISFQYRI